MQKDEKFKLLKKKEIYEFLEGSGPVNIEYKGEQLGMPYYSAAQLSDICVNFGITDIPCGSRWTYVEALIEYAIEKTSVMSFSGISLVRKDLIIYVICQRWKKLMMYIKVLLMRPSNILTTVSA